MSITKWNMRLLQSGAAFRYYKVGQSETALFFTNRNDFITKQDSFIIKRDRYYKVGQLLQSGLYTLLLNHCHWQRLLFNLTKEKKGKKQV